MRRRLRHSAPDEGGGKSPPICRSCDPASLSLPRISIPMTMGFAGRAGLLDPCRLQVLQVDESFCRRHGLWNGADFAHECQHAVEGPYVDLALARQNIFSDYQKRRKDLL